MPYLRLTGLFAAPLCYLSLIALAAALLAYPLFLGLSGAVSIQSLVSRGALVLLVVSLWPLSRWLGLRMADIGFPTNGNTFPGQITTGFAFGFAMLVLHVIVLLALHVRTWDPQLPNELRELDRHVPKTMLIALLIALSEELIFRGVLLAALVRFGNALLAVPVTAFYYASLHFLHSDLRPEGAEVNGASGLAILGDAVHHLFTQMRFDSFLALYCAGLLLATLRIVIPQGLGYCVGLHAGWVFVIKTSKKLTDRDPGSPFAWLTGDYDGVIGYLSAIWIGALWLALLRRTRRLPR